MDGVVDLFRSSRLLIFGPTQGGGATRGQQDLLQALHAARRNPDGALRATADRAEAEQALDRFTYPVVIKADGLAAGKGVVIVRTAPKRRRRWTACLPAHWWARPGPGGDRGVPHWRGSELHRAERRGAACSLRASRTTRRSSTSDKGPNTGGMGAYSDSRILTAEQRRVRDAST